MKKLGLPWQPRPPPWQAGCGSQRCPVPRAPSGALCAPAPGQGNCSAGHTGFTEGECSEGSRPARLTVEFQEPFLLPKRKASFLSLLHSAQRPLVAPSYLPSFPCPHPLSTHGSSPVPPFGKETGSPPDMAGPSLSSPESPLQATPWSGLCPGLSYSAQPPCSPMCLPCAQLPGVGRQEETCQGPGHFLWEGRGNADTSWDDMSRWTEGAGFGPGSRQMKRKGEAHPGWEAQREKSGEGTTRFCVELESRGQRTSQRGTVGCVWPQDMSRGLQVPEGGREP